MFATHPNHTRVVYLWMVAEGFDGNRPIQMVFPSPWFSDCGGSRGIRNCPTQMDQITSGIERCGYTFSLNPNTTHRTPSLYLSQDNLCWGEDDVQQLWWPESEIPLDIELIGFDEEGEELFRTTFHHQPGQTD